MLIANHPAFFPPERNVTLWRYVDLAKLIDMLERSAFPLVRADLFDDPYEGAPSRVSIESRRQDLLPSRADHIAERNARLGAQWQYSLRTKFYISCWHKSEHESAAMWRLYLNSDEGVAIRTDSDSLALALSVSDLQIGLSEVQYVDFETTDVPYGNTYRPFSFKRLSFAHEQEVRAIHKTSSEHETLTTYFVSIDLRTFVKAIHVSPTSPTWFGELIERVCTRYGIATPIVRSGLYERPTL
jgi:hypothetical protein